MYPCNEERTIKTGHELGNMARFSFYILLPVMFNGQHHSISMSEPKQSVTVTIQSKLLSVGHGPMKSIAIESPLWSGLAAGAGDWSASQFCLGHIDSRHMWVYSLRQILLHVWPLVAVLKHHIQSFESKMSKGIMGQLKKIFMECAHL